MPCRRIGFENIWYKLEIMTWIEKNDTCYFIPVPREKSCEYQIIHSSSFHLKDSGGAFQFLLLFRDWLSALCYHVPSFWLMHRTCEYLSATYASSGSVCNVPARVARHAVGVWRRAGAPRLAARRRRAVCGPAPSMQRAPTTPARRQHASSAPPHGCGYPL